MYRNRSLLSLLTAALLAVPAVQAGAQQDTTKPLTPKTVGTSVERESKRAANRTGDVVQKAGKQTEAQTKRAASSVKKVYSRKARRDARGETHGDTVSGVARSYTPGTSHGEVVSSTAKKDVPVTPKTVGTSVERESKRAANRTGDVVEKAGKQTEAQAKRSAKSVKKVYSRKARREARGDTLQ